MPFAGLKATNHLSDLEASLQELEYLPRKTSKRTRSVLLSYN
jgi:hypothetical protein